jgi:hypothetical protein
MGISKGVLMVIIKKDKEQKKIYFGITPVVTNTILEDCFFPMNYSLSYYRNKKGSFIFLVSDYVTFSQVFSLVIPEILDKMETFDINSIDNFLIPNLLQRLEEYKLEKTEKEDVYLLDDLYIIHDGKIFYIHSCLNTVEVDETRFDSTFMRGYSDNDGEKTPESILKELKAACKLQIETHACYPIIIGNDQTTELSIYYSDGSKDSSSLEEFLCQ